jgi:hypothetical protein
MCIKKMYLRALPDDADFTTDIPDLMAKPPLSLDDLLDEPIVRARIGDRISSAADHPHRRRRRRIEAKLFGKA